MVRYRLVVEAAVAVVVTLGILWVLEGVVGIGGPRPGTHHACSGRQLVIAAVGDMMLADKAQDKLDRQGYDYPFRKVKSLFDGADYVMGNIEAPITTHDELFMPSKKWSYKHEPPAAQAYADVGFDLLTLANNHTLDYGPIGLADTIRMLGDLDVTVIGGGEDEAAAREGYVIDINGTRVGVLAYMEPYGKYEEQGWFAKGDAPGCALLHRDNLKADIARMREQADLVLVHCHYGRNYKGVTKYQKKISRTVIDLGADIVNGHHPHVAQGVEIYKGKPIVYSLGNFTFGTGGRFEKGQQGYGLVARYVICDGELSSIELDLIGANNRIVKYQPTIIGEAEARTVMAELMGEFATPYRWDGSTAVVDMGGGKRAFLAGK